MRRLSINSLRVCAENYMGIAAMFERVRAMNKRAMNKMHNYR